MRATNASEATAPVSALLERRLELAHAAALARVGAEAAFLGASVGTLVLGVARLEARAHANVPVFAALLAAFCAALGWWLERRPTRAQTVRRIDRRCALDGGLVTLSERGSAPTERLRELLARRLGPRVGGSALVRAVAPAHPGMLALPCLAIAFHLWTRSAQLDIESHPEPASGRVASSALDRLDRRAHEAVRDRTVSAEVSAQLVELSETLRRLSNERPMEPLGATGRASTRELASVLERASALARDARLDPGLRSAVNDALREARLEARGSALRAGSTAAASSSNPSGSNAGSSSSTTSSDAGGDAESNERVGKRSEEPRSAVPSANVAAPTTTTAAESARAVSSAGTWWSPRYDAVVERWVESRRGPR